MEIQRKGSGGGEYLVGGPLGKKEGSRVPGMTKIPTKGGKARGRGGGKNIKVQKEKGPPTADKVVHFSGKKNNRWGKEVEKGNSKPTSRGPKGYSRALSIQSLSSKVKRKQGFTAHFMSWIRKTKGQGLDIFAQKRGKIK